MDLCFADRKPSNACLPVNLLNKRRFVLDIFLNIIWVKCCPFFFDPAVRTHSVGMSAQIVSEGKVSFQLRRVLRADVQMMLLQMLFAVVPECLPSRDAEIPFVLIADFLQGRSHFAEQGIVPDDDVDIDDRFCGQLPHGGTADVFDPQGQRTEGSMKLPSDLFKILFPSLVVGQDGDCLCFQLDFPERFRLRSVLERAAPGDSCRSII